MNLFMAWLGDWSRQKSKTAYEEAAEKVAEKYRKFDAAYDKAAAGTYEDNLLRMLVNLSGMVAIGSSGIPEITIYVNDVEFGKKMRDAVGNFGVMVGGLKFRPSGPENYYGNMCWVQYCGIKVCFPVAFEWETCPPRYA